MSYDKKDEDVVDVAFAQAAAQEESDWQTFLKWKKGEDGLSHPVAAVSKKKEDS